MVAITAPSVATLVPADENVRVSSPNEQAILAAALMQSRQTILPKRLLAPGPDAEQLQQILGAAASAPDHGQLLPWRFVVVPNAARARLAQVFADALVERDAAATSAQVAQAQEKAYRSPLLMLVVVDARRGNPDIDLFERIVSAGCAIQNVLLMATALGFGSALTSGKALKAHGLRDLFALTPGDHALCFISVGTVLAARPTRLRPSTGDYVHTLSVAASDGG
jgi:nitroreductase